MTRIMFGRARSPVNGAPGPDGESSAPTAPTPSTGLGKRPSAPHAAALNQEEAFEEVLRLAREPLDPYGPDPEPAAFATQGGHLLPGVGDDPTVRAALNTLAASHAQTASAVRSVVASAAPRREEAKLDRVTVEALGAVRAFAERPPAPIHVHVPDQSVQVDAPVVTVNVPEQPAPVVNVAAPVVELPQMTVPTPQIDVHVAAPDPAEPPTVVVNVPETVVNVQPAPVTVQPAPAAQARSILVDYDQQGRKRYVVEQTEEKGE